MRALFLVASALRLIARAVAHAIRRRIRSTRVRRYAEDPAPAAGAVVLHLPTQRTGRPAPALPPAGPRVGRHRRPEPEPLDLFAARSPRTRAQTAGLVRLVALSHHQAAARTEAA